MLRWLWEEFVQNKVKDSFEKTEAAVKQRLALLRQQFIRTVLYLFFLVAGLWLLGKGLVVILGRTLPLEYVVLGLGVVCVVVALLIKQQS
ncbi:MAG TPA: hypothetical protein VJB87_00715 [Candidatus Nanoarchaeia archaeon]|nr:hypothetical protein [Candidatus Nanoarchaeia archaeon]